MNKPIDKTQSPIIKLSNYHIYYFYFFIKKRGIDKKLPPK